MRVANRFKRGSGVYACESCKRQTRDTGGDNTDLKLCAECYEIGGIENQISDSGPNWEGKAAAEAEIKRLTEVIRKKGGKP